MLATESVAEVQEKKVTGRRIMRFISFIEIPWPRKEEEDRGNCVMSFML
jgi:hypothetical protein